VPHGRNEFHEFRWFLDLLGAKYAQTNFEKIIKSVQNLNEKDEIFERNQQKSSKIIKLIDQSSFLVYFVYKIN
jgi:hypothetical protein